MNYRIAQSAGSNQAPVVYLQLTSYMSHIGRKIKETLGVSVCE